MVHLRRLLAALAAAIFVLVPLSASAVSTADPLRAGASAADEGYIYWGFYTWDTKASTWSFSPVGANDPKQLPEDGDVYGFRWAVVLKEPRLPRADGDFDTICEGKQVDNGEKQLAFVLDYGADYDAEEGETPPEPRGVCAVVSDKFTVQQALQTVAPVRTDKSGLICAIDSYPSRGCGGVAPKGTEENPADTAVELALPADESQQPETTTTTNPDDAEPETTGTADDDTADSSSGTLTLTVALIVVVALVVGGLVLRQRRR
ncbi:MAG: hypothetical protein H0T17_07005 [Propionibacteriales bacterium]|nr:hypothetical protein [Propionibacteriales bacterium]